MNENPDYHDCQARDIDYVCQPVRSRELIAALVENYMRDPEVHRTAICNECGRCWYAVDYSSIKEDAEEGYRIRVLVVAPPNLRAQQKIAETKRRQAAAKARKRSVA